MEIVKISKELHRRSRQEIAALAVAYGLDPTEPDTILKLAIALSSNSTSASMYGVRTGEKRQRIYNASQFHMMDTVDVLNTFGLLCNEELGHGAFGLVVKCRDSVNGIDVAVKKLDKQNYASQRPNSESLRRSLFREVELLKQNWNVRACDPRILCFRNFIETRQHYLIISELIAGTDLAHVDFSVMTFSDKLRIATDVVAGVSKIHEKGIVHRDIKPDNIMITDPPNPTIKIIDFGLGCMANPDVAPIVACGRGSTCGTPLYLAPEVWHKGRTPNYAIPDHYKIDVFSTGVTLCYIFLNNVEIFNPTPSLIELYRQRNAVPDDIPDFELVRNNEIQIVRWLIMTGKHLNINFTLLELYPEISTDVADSLGNMLESMLEVDYNQRSKLNDVITALETIKTTFERESQPSAPLNQPIEIHAIEQYDDESNSHIHNSVCLLPNGSGGFDPPDEDPHSSLEQWRREHPDY